MSDEEILTQDEKDTLLNGIPDSDSDSGESLDPGELVKYDFKHPAHKLKAQLPLLEVANQRFAKDFSAALSALLRQQVSVAVKNFSMLKFEEYTHSLDDGVSINRVSFSPLPGTSLLCLDADLVFSLVDRFFGGGGSVMESAARRRLTHSELRLVNLAIKGAFGAMTSAWSTICDIQPEFLREEINSQMTSSANPSEVLVTSKFKVMFSKGEGEFHIAIPYPSLEPIKPLLKASVDKPREGDTQWQQQFGSMVVDSSVELQGVISETLITLEQLLNFKEGDFIPLGQNQLATFYSEKIPLFKAEVGASNGMISAKMV